MKRAARDLEKHLSWFENLDPIRQTVLLDMCFNLGIGGLLKFKDTLKAIETGDYAHASMYMLDSLWAKQVKGRAIRLSQMMLTGNWPDGL